MPTNVERADRIYRLMLVYKQYKGDNEDYTTDVTDLLTDLMHYCDEMGIDFDRRMGFARAYYEAEYEEEQEVK